ncbi:hypothetical protein RAS1_17280 [Phycisphaerae bacterium RAS1]|nr:hypothetical protein RAS1_17280 [Phycisphaerae bacterium RAS1]
MSKPILGLIVGGILGIFDGLTALVSAGDDPKIREEIVMIIIGSTFKGLVAGIACGYFARRFNSLPLGILFGVIVGFILAALVALGQMHYFLHITIPGSIVGAIVGFATQQYGVPPRGRTA